MTQARPLVLVCRSACLPFETGAPIQWKLSLEVSEEQFRVLIYPPQITQAKDKPAGHWITIARVENCDEGLLKELIAGSYAKAIAKMLPPTRLINPATK